MPGVSKSKSKSKVKKPATKTTARAKAKTALERAGISRDDSVTLALRKLDRSLSKVFGKDYDTQLEPHAFTLAEKASGFENERLTATGSIRCTFSRIRCSLDVDG